MKPARAIAALRGWFDTTAGPVSAATEQRVDWLRIVPFIGMHLACLAVFWVGVSATALWVALALYLLRMFAITGAYHRYFAHRSYRTSRVLQFLLALIGAASVQRGPIWWAAHHRHHHQHSDTEHDPHSPLQRGFWWSHMVWFLTPAGFRTDTRRVQDLMRYPELVWLDRFDIAVPVLLALGLKLWGDHLAVAHPELGTDGWQLLVWGFFISTVVLFHATVTINSLAHVWGRRRYATGDESRNNAVLALITLGEGWHNNHHRYPVAVRQGHRWWELDLTFYLLWVLSRFGLIWDLRPVPAAVLEEGRRGAHR